jgi:hypothetical protein
MYDPAMDTLVERWWNGSWGRLTRRDVWLRRTDVGWVVVARRGSEGPEHTSPPLEEARAREMLTTLTEVRPDDQAGARWRQLPVDHPPTAEQV